MAFLQSSCRFQLGRGRRGRARRLGGTLLAGLLLAAVPASAQDEIVTKDRSYSGQVVSASPAGVVILVGGQQLTVPRGIIVSLRVAEPPAITRGLSAYAQGNHREALSQLEQAATQFQGLDAPWAARGLFFLGRAALATGDYNKAQKYFELFAASYPQHAMFQGARVGLVHIEAARKNYAAALDRYRDLAEYYDQQLKPPRDELEYAAEIYLGLGQCLEQLAKPKEALEAYLRVVAIYPSEEVCPQALYRSALLFKAMNRPDQAEIRLAELLRFYPASPWAKPAAELRKNLGGSAAPGSA